MSEKSIQAAAPMGRDSMPKLAAINRQTLLQKLAGLPEKTGFPGHPDPGTALRSAYGGGADRPDRLHPGDGDSQFEPEPVEWEYNSVNVSMMPAIINTVFMTALALGDRSTLWACSLPSTWWNMPSVAASWSAWYGHGGDSLGHSLHCVRPVRLPDAGHRLWF